MSAPKTLLERAAGWTRFALLAAIAVVLGLIVTTPRNEYPLSMSRAHAETISAAPGFLCTSISATNAERFYLVDTNKQVICVYSVNNDQLRLQSARKFDNDTGIPDGEYPITANGKTLKIANNANGLSRSEAKDYGDGLNKLIEEGKKLK